MSKTQSTTPTDPKGKEIWVACSTCKVETAHRCLTEDDVWDESPGGDIQAWWQYYTIQCGGCKDVSFCVESQNSEDYDYDEQGMLERCTTQKVYPNRLAGRAILKGAYSLPHGVAQIYKETHESITSNQYVLTGIGLRAIIEAVCANQNTTEDNLKNKIDELVSLGVLTQSGADILHKIRLLGNKAAHEAKMNTKEELFAALEVVEHLLVTVYIIPKTADRLNQ